MHGIHFVFAALFLVDLLENNTCTCYSGNELGDTAAFYLLRNGSNTPDCGATPGDACATLPHLLDVFYRQHRPTLPALRLTSDISITINDTLKKHREWLSSLDINFRKFDESPHDINLILNSVNLENCTYESKDLNVEIEHARLINFRFMFDGKSGRSHVHDNKNRSSAILKNRRHLEIRNASLIGSGSNSLIFLLVSRGLFSCDNLAVTAAYQQHTIVNITDFSTAQINSSKFYQNSVSIWKSSESSILTVHQSNLTINRSNFTENIASYGGVLYVAVQSVTNVNQCHFKVNKAFNYGGAIYARHTVSLAIKDSSFMDNHAFYHGGAIYSTAHAVVSLSNSNFTNNSAIIGSGGALAIGDRSQCCLDECVFRKNWAGRDSAVIYAITNNKLSIKNSIFSENFSKFKSGVLRVHTHAEALIHNCTFVGNMATLSESVISANSFVHINISDSLFENNMAQYVGVLAIGDNSIADVTGCIFKNNLASVTALAQVVTQSALNVKSSHFYDNDCNRVFYALDNSTLTMDECTVSNRTMATNSIICLSHSLSFINNCQFYNNSQYHDGGVVFAEESKVKVNSSLFMANDAPKGGVFFLSEQSQLIVDQSMFRDNTAADGSVALVVNSSAVFLKSNVTNCTGFGYGGIISAHSAKLVIKHSNFSSGVAFYGGSLYLQDRTSLAASHSIFENGTSREGGVIYKVGSGSVSLDHCLLINNNAQHGGAIFHYTSSFLRLSGGYCLQPLKSNCITFQIEKGQANHWFTYNFTMDDGNLTVNSNTTKNFIKSSEHHRMIQGDDHFVWEETQFAAVLPVDCGRNCSCYYVQDTANVYDCSARDLYSLPYNIPIPRFTDWLDFSDNNITTIDGNYSFPQNITKLNVSNNKLQYIDEEKVGVLRYLNMLDLSHNKLERLPQSIVKLTNLTSVWLSNNPFHCDCDMLWMKDWINNFNQSKRRIVKDFFDVKCPNGTPVYRLDPEGCYSTKLTLLDKIGIGGIAAVVVIIVIAIIAISRRWNEVKWLMYLHFDILGKNDGEENLEGLEADAFLSYSNDDIAIVQEVFMKYDGVTPILEEDHGFQLILHQRDFIPGEIILNNIGDSVRKTRRMIMLLSRNFLSSNWCMEEFRLAQYKMVNENRKYLIVVLLEELDIDAVPRELQMYLRTYTYIDATKDPRDIPRLRKRVRFGMPGTPLSELRVRTEDRQDELNPEHQGPDAESVPSIQVQTPNEERTPLLYS